MKQVNWFILLLLIVFSLSGKEQDDRQQIQPFFSNSAVICSSSALLPALNDALFFHCFDLSVADALRSQPKKLKHYLDLFPLSSVTAQYYYWYYLRTDQVLNATLILLPIINESVDNSVVERYRAILTAPNRLILLLLDKGKKLLDRSGKLSKIYKVNAPLEERFVALFYDYLERTKAPIPDLLEHESVALLSVAYSQLLNLLGFPGIQPIELQQLDKPARTIFYRFYRIVPKKKRSRLFMLYSYHAFQAVAREEIIPANFFLWNASLRDVIRIKWKHSDIHSSLAAIITLSQPELVPPITVVDHIDRDKAGVRFTSSKECNYLQQRQSLFQSNLFSIASDFNRMLLAASGCLPFIAMPARITKERILITRSAQWFTGAAVALRMLMNTPELTKNHRRLMTIVLLQAAESYQRQQTKNVFGDALSYAASTHSLNRFLDFYFLAPAGLLTPEEFRKVVQFQTRMVR